jgi:uncharacterized membrane protein
VLLFCASYALPTNAWADLRFCNRTGANTTVAIAYVGKDAPGTTTNGHAGVTSEGWWILSPGECAKVSGIHVGNHWVYYHAQSPKGTWDGTAKLCVPSRSFTVGDHFRRAEEGCPAGSRLTGFRRIDSEAANYTMTLQ